MIDIRSLSKSYGTQKILKGLSLSIKKGAVTSIVGPNACGKTTLIKCILGLAVQTSGELWIDGKKTDARGEFRRKIGYMPQTPNFPGNLCLRELLEMLENLRGEHAISRQELLHHFGLEKFLKQPLMQLSGGTRQKVAAVIAFMFKAPIVILDEPTVGLDPITAAHFKELVLKEAQRGTTVILVSHIMTEVEQIATEMAFISEGEIAFSGAIADLLKTAGTLQLERAVTQLFETHKGRTL